jgi:glycerol 3-phosphatase-2
VLRSFPQRLCDAYDVAMLDLDGVVYIGSAAVTGVAEHLAAARAAGLRTAFITNNASRTPDQVAGHLLDLGVPAAPPDVVTSAQAAARVLRDQFGRGAPVVLLGGDGLSAALEETQLRAVGVDDEAVAVVTGYGPEVRWREIMQVAVRVREGLPWVASNTDHTIPTPYGVAPGHGVLVDTIQRFSGVAPQVAGKPERPLLEETMRRMRSTRPLMVGDRLDTDIEGANRIGVDSLLVLTGVTGLDELVAAGPEVRPTYLTPDLGGLLQSQPVPALVGGGRALGGWTARAVDGRLTITGEGTTADWWRTVATVAWGYRDRTGAVVDITGLAVPGPVAAEG